MPTVTDLKFARKRGGKVEVELDGERWLRLEADTVVAFRLKRGMALDSDSQARVAQFDERLRARQTLARYTALAVRSARQARQRLARAGFGEAAIDDALAHAVEREWIDDERFARAFVRRRNALRPAGPARLAVEMEALGIDRDTAQAAVDAHGPDSERQRADAERLARKRLASWARRYDAATARRRLRDYLIRQGYDEKLVGEVLDLCADNELETNE